MQKFTFASFFRSALRVGFAVLLVFAATLVGIWFYVAQPVWAPSVASEHSPDVDRMRDVVKTLSVTFHPRDYLHRDNLEKCAEFIADHFREAGGEVGGRMFKGYGDTYRNVSCFFDGPGDRRVVIGAHYDSAEDTPGADDNASGVAGLIELAYLMKQLDLNCDVELVAYCLEEPPFFGTERMGSHVHAEGLVRDHVEVAGMIALEMIGYFSDEKGSQLYPAPFFKAVYPSAGTFIAVVATPAERAMVAEVKKSLKTVEGLPVRSFIGPEWMPGIDYSDHRNYWKFGFPAVMITDTAFYRNMEYHAAGDTWDRLEYAHMAKVVEGVARAVEALP